MSTGNRATGAVAGVVLAAGRSRRMGRPKPLLEVDERTFMERAVATLRGGGCDPLVAVVSEPGSAIGAAAEAAGASVAENPSPDSEQIESLRCGLAALPAGVAGAMVLPVDHPLVEAATVAALIHAFRSGAAAIVRPTHEGRPGHPTLFGASVFPDLRSPDLERGAESVVEARAAEVDDVAVADAGVLADIDTPSDHARHGGA